MLGGKRLVPREAQYSSQQRPLHLILCARDGGKGGAAGSLNSRLPAGRLPVSGFAEISSTCAGRELRDYVSQHEGKDENEATHDYVELDQVTHFIGIHCNAGSRAPRHSNNP